MNLTRYLAIFITLLGLSYFTPQEASANTTDPNEDLISQVKIYDGDNNLIPYSLEELKKIIRFETNNSSLKNNSSSLENNNSFTPFALQRTYKSGAFSFLNYIYLNNKNAFKNPVDIQITPKGEAKPFSLTIYRNGSGGNGDTIELPGGWTGTVHYSLSGYSAGNYTFMFTNEHYSTNYMENVTLIYTY